MKTKKCNGCGVKKRLKDFFERPNGLPKTPCKKCMHGYRLNRYQNDAEYRKRENERSLKWKEKNPKHLSRYMKNWRKENAEHVSRYCKKYNASRVNSIEQKARWKLRDQIQAGKINRPSNCSRCGAQCKAEGHHPDYKKPLIVIWLCPKCHKQQHKKENQK